MSAKTNQRKPKPGLWNYVLDCKGREILPGDTIKMFHFVGRNRKRYFMYKYVERVERREGWPPRVDALEIKHLCPEGGSFFLLRQGQKMERWEIVQGYGPDLTSFDQRPKRVARSIEL